MQQVPTLKRVYSIDILRGIIMVIMALDHARDYFSIYRFNPTDLTQTTPQLFFTRWITHLCAPLFVFLAGTGSYLWFSKGKTKKQASSFLLTRGLWLIILELTVVRLGWLYNFDYSFTFIQVIWVIGCSMIFLSLLVYLKPVYAGIVGLTLIFLHNTLDGIQASGLGNAKLLWMILHETNMFTYGNNNSLFVLYPVIPWIGVMAFGFYCGTFFTWESSKRKKLFFRIGIGSVIFFIVLRFTNLYGDPSKWQMQDATWKTFASFINCSKYPPSLLFLLMTIGPGFIMLALLEKINTNRITSFFMIYGRVPLFYYVLHIYLIHLMALITALVINYQPVSRFFTNQVIFNLPNWGFSLPFVYSIWLLTVLILYFPCKWYMKVKATNHHWTLSYL
jgi:uncharacterized membrane protein